MSLSRRSLLKSVAATGALAASGDVVAPAIAQNKPVRIGILAPRSGIAAAPGENGIRATQWAVERFNAAGGIAGRKIELVIEEETSPKDTIERFSKLVQQEKVDCVQGIISTGAGLALGPVVEESRALTIYWDGTTQDGVDEKIPNPRYLFRSTDNECEAVMASLLAIKYWKGKFATVAGINPDYSYGRNNMAAFVAILNRFNIEHKVVTEQWPKVGTMDLTSHVAALKSAKPDLIFSSLLFADLPVFMKQAHAAELTKDTKLVLPAAGWQHTLMKKSSRRKASSSATTHSISTTRMRRPWPRSSWLGTNALTRTIPNGKPTGRILRLPPTRRRSRKLRPPRAAGRARMT